MISVPSLVDQRHLYSIVQQDSTESIIEDNNRLTDNSNRDLV